ncbi:MAG TPA: GvpL/GvpF family gas vesicle protein [Terriglobales bacterium]|nr:GvpL/GvpF family gas vesicle protein [Terriglobales bacterium]
MPRLAKPTSKSSSRRAPARVLYLYGISRMPQQRTPAIAAEGIDGSAPVEAFRAGKYLCWVSRVSKKDFADQITERMQNLDWLAGAGLRHQRIVAEISKKLAALPARFGTIFLSELSLTRHVEEREPNLRAAFARVADADEYGIKIFAKPTAARRKRTLASSGAEYLKRKAESLRPRTAAKGGKEIEEFAAALKQLAIADSPGGKASSGQPGLLWHASLLVRRKDREKLDSLLRKYADRWQELRRIDCSGPWPPYSFVGEHV